jgi:preprotein translocase subunit SecD
MLYLTFLVLGEAIGFTLTLAGIAGAIVAIGVTADSFIVYFERIRDEAREGRSLRSAVESGWLRARHTIIVADMISVLAAVLLYFFAVGGVRGFAFTLGLTTLIDLLVVFIFTKPLMTILAKIEFFSSGHPLSGLSAKSVGTKSPMTRSSASEIVEG